MGGYMWGKHMTYYLIKLSRPLIMSIYDKFGPYTSSKDNVSTIWDNFDIVGSFGKG